MVEGAGFAPAMYVLLMQKMYDLLYRLNWFGYAYRSQVLAVPLSRYFLRSKDLKVRETSRALTHIRNPMVCLMGLEPMTPCLKGRCSTAELQAH